ncbi:glycerophosphodiester phosphodiesterase family protein [Hymenobacter sp. ASUV-10]|uniref:Glycerophosphodiester phosphodiesterase family protein n=1 Tax=Hymenobacter aranciens TaxID=3063996 RepID=A0ABT9B5S0_9BACT|nr:glycerophosphodiester phosphodiesterase family protein [Hymenobacter sp. ASUV-10]MDO7873145.1 glycerophosphodiester phosphodiesterase family protein [Hymenobacter sp. ASUV-10]
MFSYSRPLVHGHRGCRGLLPENTLPAFLHALKLGVDVLELDVVISADHEVVVSHEPWMSSAICLTPDGQPISPGTETQHNLYQLPYATIRRYDCGQRQHSDFPAQLNEPAYKPLLREVLTTVEIATRQLGRPAVGYSIELKSEPAHDGIFQPFPAQFVELVLAVLHEYQVLPRTTLLCFDPRILQLAQRLVPAVATCLLLEADQAWLPSVKKLGFVPTVLGPDFRTVNLEAVTAVRAAHPSLQLIPWTVNQPDDMQRLLGWGMDGITTDYPDQLLALLAR